MEDYKYEDSIVKVTNYYSKEEYSFPDKHEKKSSKKEIPEFLFLKKKESVSKDFIFIYPDDSSHILKKKIENKALIYSDYQLLLFKKNKEIIGHKIDIIDKINKIIPLNKDYNIILKDKDIIGDKIYSGIILINLLDHLDKEYDNFWLKGLSEYQLNDLWVHRIYPYWPSITSNEFINLVKNNEIVKGIKDDIYDDLKIIRNIKKEDILKKEGFKIGPYSIVKKSTFIQYNNPFNIYYIFDKFIPNKRYSNIIAKFNENKIYLKYHKKYYDKKNTILSVPKNNGIKIGMNITLYANGSMRYKNITKKDFEYISKFINEDNFIIDKNNTYKFSFQILSEYSITKNFLLKSFPLTIERDYRESKDISFYYKKVSFNTKNFIYRKGLRVQEGAFVKIIQNESVYNISVSNIKSKNDMKYLYNFLVRVFYLYSLEMKKTNNIIKKRSNVFKSTTNLKNIDPILFNFKRNGKKIYSRICQKNKQPIGFFKDSKVFEEYKKDNNLSEDDYLEYKNITYEDKKSIFLCPNKDYTNVTFFKNIRHNEGHCIPCCSKKDKSKSDFYKECISGIVKEEVKKNIPSQTNLFYIRKYNPYKYLEYKKFSYLPTILNNFLNKHDVNCNIKFNIVVLNKSCYILLGSKKEDNLSDLIGSNDILNNKKNIVVIEYNSDNDNVELINYFNKKSFIGRIKTMKNMFILKHKKDDTYTYNLICKVSSLEYKNYEIIDTFTYKDSICKKFANILENNIKKGFNNTPLYKISKRYNVEPKKDIKQLIESGGIVTYIIVKDEIKIPIIPMLPVEDIKIVNSFKANKKDIVDRYIESDEISEYIVEKSEQYLIGYKFKINNLIIFFESEKIKEDILQKKKSILYFTEKKETFKTKIMEDIDMYYKYFFHISYWLNEGRKDKKKITFKDLEKRYGGQEDKRFVNDYSLLLSGKYNEMEYWKEHKNDIIDGKKNTISILKSLTKDKIIISTSRGKKNTNRSNIRNIDNKLYMNKDLYNKYTKLIAYEIDNNSLKRYQLLNQKISKIIDKNKFSQNENIEIIRINSSL